MELLLFVVFIYYFFVFVFIIIAVFISNHQCYSDWLYVWILFYFSGIGGGIIIVLKKSLRSIPIASWAMRLWDFIFLSTWEVDRDEIGSSLLTLGKRATKHDRPLALLLYPEGTLVSALTRPKSEAYAKSSGIVSFIHFPYTL